MGEVDWKLLLGGDLGVDEACDKIKNVLQASKEKCVQKNTVIQNLITGIDSFSHHCLKK